MVFDLRGALLKKQEVETARLADFEFRLRVRTMRLLAAALDVDADALVRSVARQPDAAIVAGLAGKHGIAANHVSSEFARCQAEARRQLIAERGDPSPYRLA